MSRNPDTLRALIEVLIKESETREQIAMRRRQQAYKEYEDADNEVAHTRSQIDALKDELGWRE